MSGLALALTRLEIHDGSPVAVPPIVGGAVVGSRHALRFCASVTPADRRLREPRRQDRP